MVRTLTLLFIFALRSCFAANIVADKLVGATISRGAEIITSQDASKGKDSKLVRRSDTATSDEASPLANREAAEAFAPPSKIDDSLFGSWAPRFPAFVEKYPYFYSASFVVAGFAFLGFVCAYVHYEDAKDEERRAILREIRREAAMGGAMPNHRMGASFGTPPQLSQAALEAAAQAAAASLARAPPLSIPSPAARAGFQEEYEVEESTSPAPKVRTGRAMEQGITALTNAMTSMTGLLVGEKKLGSAAGSAETTSASGASTPRSLVSSQVSSTGTSASRSKGTSIRNGTVLVARMNEIIFASPTSWQEIGELTAGQQVHAAGPPEVHESYAMVPIKPRGAVDLKTLEVVREH